MFDPYEVLGVARDAAAATIRKAYRRAAKTAHPDAGGTPDTFRALQRAHDILTDEQRRARYDATGNVDEPDAEQSPDAAALAIINQMLASVLASPNNPVKCDLVAEMVTALDRDIAQQRAALPKLKVAAERCRKVRDRFRRKSRGDNQLATMLGWQLQQIDATATAIERQIADRERAKQVLADYRFEWDRAPIQTMRMYGSATASTATRFRF